MIRDVLNQYAASTERVFKHDRTRSVGASEIGQCARKVWYTKHLPPPEKGSSNWGATTRGSVMEDAFWVKAMKARFGKNLKMAGARQRTLVDGSLSATPDGLIVGLPKDALAHLGVPDIESDCILTECKSIDPRVNLQKEKSTHAYQAQVQLGLVRLKTRYKPMYVLISYMDASFWNEVSEFVVRHDEAIFANAQKRAKEILSADDASLMKPEGWIAGGSECDTCPFVRPCGVVRSSGPGKQVVEATPKQVEEITHLCHAAAAVQDAANTNAARLRELKDEIKGKMREAGIRWLTGVVTWAAVRGRQSWNVPALIEAAKEAGVDVEEFSTVGDPTDRLEIKL